MNYETASAEEIAAHFSDVSRQRHQQVLKKFQQRGNDAVVAKIQRAKRLLRDKKYIEKYGCNKEQRKKCDLLWSQINNRCGKVEGYLDCTNEFESFDAFKNWAIVQVGFGVEGFELDKDILVKGSRVYSPSTCIFVPLEVNSLFSGCYRARKRGKYPLGVSYNKGSKSFVAQMSDRQERGLDKYLGSFPTIEEAFACYKKAKEAKIRKLAEKWKDQIDPKTYAALLARTVEWDD